MRTTKVTKTRRYRVTKRIARRPKATFTIGLGNVEQVITLHFPEKAVFQEKEIPKERNLNAVRIRIGDNVLVYYKNDEKGFIYDSDKNLCGRFDRFDIKRAFVRIGGLLKEIKTQKTYSTILRRGGRKGKE